MKIKPIYVLLFVVLVMVIIFFEIDNNDQTKTIPMIISVIALLVSIISAFRNDIFPYNLQIFSEGLHLIKTPALPPSTGVAIVVLLPVTFFNKGYGECFVKKVHLVVKQLKTEGNFIFLPAVEIDMQAFMRQGKGLNASNINGSFVGFLLESKKGIMKNIVFTLESGPDKPILNWVEDSYTFEIQVLVEGEKGFKKYYEINQEITQSNLHFLIKSSNAIFFM